MDIQLQSILSTTVSDLDTQTEGNIRSLFHHYDIHRINHRVSVLSSPPEHEFGVFVLHMLIHQLQQQRPHDVRVILQFAVQRHRQQRGEITPRPGVKVWTSLQRVDKLHI